MNRRRFLLMSVGFTLLSTTAARADYVEDIVKWLTKEGYNDIDVTRTLLGRVRIVASKDGQLRELVCNPRTGEILRDVWSGAGGGERPAASSPTGGNDDNNNSDDDDNSGHGGDDDDNSGQGGSSDDHEDGSDDGGEGDKSGHGGGDDD
jgi:hypothetical protein